MQLQTQKLEQKFRYLCIYVTSQTPYILKFLTLLHINMSKMPLGLVLLLGIFFTNFDCPGTPLIGAKNIMQSKLSKLKKVIRSYFPSIE